MVKVEVRIAANEAEAKAEVEVTVVGISQSQGAPDTAQIHQKNVVTAIIDMVRTVGTAWLLTPVPGSTRQSPRPEGPASLENKTKI